VSVFIVRHAVAIAKQDWASSDQQRPLTRVGEHEALSIAQWINDAPSLLISSPTLRCVGSLLPLAERFQLDLFTRTELLPGHPAGAAELVRSLLTNSFHSAVVCTHGEVIPNLLNALPIISATDTLDNCDKGSIWEIETLPNGLNATYHQSAQRHAVRAGRGLSQRIMS
jgi:phosphohistidine phosphatase SixA